MVRLVIGVVFAILLFCLIYSWVFNTNPSKKRRY